MLRSHLSEQFQSFILPFCFLQHNRVAALDSSSATPGDASGSGGGATGSTTAPTTRTRSAAAKVGVLCRSNPRLTPESSLEWFWPVFRFEERKGKMGNRNVFK